MAPGPPAHLLARVCEAAACGANDAEAALPREVAAFVYFGALAAGLLRCGQRVARREFKAAGAAKEAPQLYLDLCVRAIDTASSPAEPATRPATQPAEK